MTQIYNLLMALLIVQIIFNTAALTVMFTIYAKMVGDR